MIANPPDTNKKANQICMWVYRSLLIIATLCLLAIEGLSILCLGFPNSYMLPVLSIYIAVITALGRYKKRHHKNEKERHRPKLSKIQKLVVEAVKRYYITPRQIEEHILSQHSFNRTEIFIALMQLVKYGYLKETSGQYDLTEKASVLD